MELKNKVVVITGSSKGLGRALAEIFIKEGSQVILNSPAKKELEKVSKEIGGTPFTADITDKKEVQKLADFAVKKFSRIDIWINNAGIQIAPSPLEEINVEKAQRLFDINFFGYFYGCQTALRFMKKQKNGTIININSTAGLEGKPQISAYSASKFAIKGLTESVREESKGSEIKILGVFPGGMKTEIYKEKYPVDIDKYMETEYVAQKVIENLKKKKPEEELIIRRPSV